ncbi:hypothetical protein L6232_23800, partial [Shewanella sp. C31]|nr:hypothetical protein [Shewanella electrica]
WQYVHDLKFFSFSTDVRRQSPGGVVVIGAGTGLAAISFIGTFVVEFKESIPTFGALGDCESKVVGYELSD